MSTEYKVLRRPALDGQWELWEHSSKADLIWVPDDGDALSIKVMEDLEGSEVAELARQFRRVAEYLTGEDPCK